MSRKGRAAGPGGGVPGLPCLSARSRAPLVLPADPADLHEILALLGEALGASQAAGVEGIGGAPSWTAPAVRATPAPGPGGPAGGGGVVVTADRAAAESAAVPTECSEWPAEPAVPAVPPLPACLAAAARPCSPHLRPHSPAMPRVSAA